MTDPERPAPGDAQQRAVRDLLASARHDEPMPDGVVARLDATLADLVAQRSAVRSAPVVELARRRRRRLVGTGLVAAAAVVVAGVGLGQVLPLESGGDDASTAGAAREFGAQEDSSADREDSGATASEGAPAEGRSAPSADGAPVDLSSSDPDRRIRRALRQAAPPTDGLLGKSGCLVPGVPAAAQGLAVLWDGQPARALYLPPGEPVRIEVHLCDPPALVREVALP